MKQYKVDFYQKYSQQAADACLGTGIFPSVLLAQMARESSGKMPDGSYHPGASELAHDYNNFFGIKDWKGHTGQKVTLPTPNDGTKFSTFCVYPSPTESIRGYVQFLKENPRYSDALKATDPEIQITKIAQAGYAEAGNYASSLISDMRTYNLKQYDDLAASPLHKVGKSPLIWLLGLFFIGLVLTSKK